MLRLPIHLQNSLGLAAFQTGCVLRMTTLESSSCKHHCGDHAFDGSRRLEQLEGGLETTEKRHLRRMRLEIIGR